MKTESDFKFTVGDVIVHKASLEKFVIIERQSAEQEKEELKTPIGCDSYFIEKNAFGRVQVGKIYLENCFIQYQII